MHSNREYFRISILAAQSYIRNDRWIPDRLQKRVDVRMDNQDHQDHQWYWSRRSLSDYNTSEENKERKCVLIES